MMINDELGMSRKEMFLAYLEPLSVLHLIIIKEVREKT
jgi:hypothetical protein